MPLVTALMEPCLNRHTHTRTYILHGTQKNALCLITTTTTTTFVSHLKFECIITSSSKYSHMHTDRCFIAPHYISPHTALYSSYRNVMRVYTVVRGSKVFPLLNSTTREKVKYEIIFDGVVIPSVLFLSPSPDFLLLHL